MHASYMHPAFAGTAARGASANLDSVSTSNGRSSHSVQLSWCAQARLRRCCFCVYWEELLAAAADHDPGGQQDDQNDHGKTDHHGEEIRPLGQVFIHWICRQAHAALDARQSVSVSRIDTPRVEIAEALTSGLDPLPDWPESQADPWTEDDYCGMQ